MKIPEFRIEYEEKVRQESDRLGVLTEIYDLEKAWSNLKGVLLTAATEVCRTSKCGRRRKVTRWWMDEVKASVREKKEQWKQYLITCTQEDYDRYKAVSYTHLDVYKRQQTNIINIVNITYHNVQDTQFFVFMSFCCIH